jgi:hypothetical protein
VPGALEDGEDGVELGIMKCQALLEMVKLELSSVIMKCQALLKMVKMELNPGL